MAGSRWVLLVGLGLLPASLWAQQIVRKQAVSRAKKPANAPLATHADSVAHYQRATYPGGEAQAMQEVQRRVRYPAAALRAQLEGRVVVALAVEADGTVGEVRVLKSPSPLLSNEVLQAVKGLGTFEPARQYGQPVRSTVTLPVSFHIVGNTKSKALLLPVRPVLRGPVQPQVAALAGRRAVPKLVSWQDSSYWVDKEKGRPMVLVHRHYFTYDRLGRPATHAQEHWSGGQLTSTQVLRYEYGPDGRLAAKVGDHQKYVFQYGPSGALSSSTGYYYQRQQEWVVYEETRLSEKARQPDGSRIVTQETSYRGESGLRREQATDYSISADSLVAQTTTYYRNHQALPRPQVTTLAYDAKPNPFGELLAERWYQFEVGLGSPHNVVRALAYGKPWKNVTYTYNEAGYPTQAVTRRADQSPYQTQTFTYANIVVPALAPLAAEENNDVAVYPNPAPVAAVVSVRATKIGKGAATLRLFDAATGGLRRQTEHQVATTFEVALPTAGLAKGSYLVEITSGSTVARGRLLVE